MKKRVVAIMSLVVAVACLTAYAKKAQVVVVDKTVAQIEEEINAWITPTDSSVGGKLLAKPNIFKWLAFEVGEQGSFTWYMKTDVDAAVNFENSTEGFKLSFFAAQDKADKEKYEVSVEVSKKNSMKGALKEAVSFEVRPLTVPLVYEGKTQASLSIWVKNPGKNGLSIYPYGILNKNGIKYPVKMEFPE
ncbi:MAG: hypothetical protein NTW04_03805 [Elusimicrobia bacterium]|nr:hypothetical protein [Elusimicrobiota bacterium]